MTTLLRRLASPSLFTSPFSTPGISAFNGRPQEALRPVQDERQASVGAARVLQLSTMEIDMHVKDFVSHTKLVQQFLSTDDCSAVETCYSFRLPDEAAVTSFKLEIGDEHAIEDESRPSKRAKKIYNQAVRNETPAAILREVGPGVFEANLGCIPPDVEVTIVVNFAERIRFNARGNLIIKYPAFSPPAWSSSSEETRISLKIEIIQKGLVTISSPTHQKLLSINAGVMSAAREAESFALLQQPAEELEIDQPNSATVSLSANRKALQRDFELVIETLNEDQRTVASLFTTNRFGHAVLFLTFRPCDLFNGEQDIQWSVNIDLDHPWNRCSFDLREMNLTRISTRAASLSPTKFHFIQSPKLIPKISHRQTYSTFFLLDFGNSSELFLDSVCITATSPGGVYTARISVERANTADSTLQKLCVSSILRDAYNTLMSRTPHHAFADSQPLSLSSLAKSAERLGQMYSVCNHWTSKIAADSMRDTDDDVDSNGPQLFADDLSRHVLPTNFSFADNDSISLTHPIRYSKHIFSIPGNTNADYIARPKLKRLCDEEAERDEESTDEEPEAVIPVGTAVYRRSNRSPKTSDTDSGFACATHRVSETERPSLPISDPSVGKATPVEERLRFEPQSLDFPSYISEVEPFNFNTSPQEIDLDAMDGLDYADYYLSIAEEPPITDTGLDSWAIRSQEASTTHYCWDDDINASQTQDIDYLKSNRGETSSAKGEVVTHLAENSSPSRSQSASLQACRPVPDVREAIWRCIRRPQLPSELGAPRHPIPPPMNQMDQLLPVPSPPPFAGYQPPYCPPSENSKIMDGPHRSSVLTTDRPTLPPMTHFADAYKSPDLTTENASFSSFPNYGDYTPSRRYWNPQANGSDHHLSHAMGYWNPQGNDSHEVISPTSLSSNRTYMLQVHLRCRIENRFISGTRAWLVERIESSTHNIYSTSGSEAVVDTMLVLAFVKAYLAQFYEKVEQHVGLILDSWEYQKMALDELTLRIIREGDGVLEEGNEPLTTAVLEFLSLCSLIGGRRGESI